MLYNLMGKKIKKKIKYCNIIIETVVLNNIRFKVNSNPHFWFVMMAFMRFYPSSSERTA